MSIDIDKTTEVSITTNTDKTIRELNKSRRFMGSADVLLNTVLCDDSQTTITSRDELLSTLR